jgi:outer membrane protein assembly factor BamD (BamD/ComL family)
MILVGGLLFPGSASHAEEEAVYTVEERGRSTLSSVLDKRMATSEEQWEYARETQNRGRLKKADSRMLYLVRRWPNSREAPWAQRARADMLYARGKLKKAFQEYQYLIDNYSSRMSDYDQVLESQYEIAVDIMNSRRFRWLFGGFRAPEYAVDYFEDVIRNGPQWDRAPEAQFLIGQCHQKAKDLELAISAYAVLGYRYPDSRFAEEGAWQQIVCLDKLRREYPDSPDLLDRTLTATTVFLSTYPQSDYKGRIIQLRNGLYEVKALKVFNDAEFYARVPKKAEAAIIYFEQLIEEYPKSRLVPEAHKRIAEIQAMMMRPLQAAAPASVRQTPAAIGQEPENAEE